MSECTAAEMSSLASVSEHMNVVTGCMMLDSKPFATAAADAAPVRDFGWVASSESSRVGLRWRQQAHAGLHRVWLVKAQPHRLRDRTRGLITTTNPSVETGAWKGPRHCGRPGRSKRRPDRGALGTHRGWTPGAGALPERGPRDRPSALPTPARPHAGRGVVSRGESRWLKVVVRYESTGRGWIVTAFARRSMP